MAQNPFGPGVSRYTVARDKQLAGVVFQALKPPLDSELNLISLVDLEMRAEEVRSRICSGWLMDESNPRADYTTSPQFSNLFYFGRRSDGEVRNFLWANVNGWIIPVGGTRTGAPPLAANDADTWNKIMLNPPSTSTGGNRVEFVFLEVWLATIDVDPPAPAVAPGKPQRGFIYRHGNVEGGFSYLPDDLIDPKINFETTRRVQIQYRIRVVADVNLAQYPEGFDPTLVFAQGLLPAPSSVPFENMRKVLGDPGLWRAGTGDPATFGTADGYVYAIPICGVFRRNSAGFSDVGNLAGAFNRNSIALGRDGAVTYTNQIVLPSDLSETATSFTMTSIAGTFFSTMNSFGEAYFRVDDEIVRVNNIVAVSPTQYTITVDRGQLQTVVKPHKAGTPLVIYTVRPDGLFADQIASTDILDLRHSVADKFDYHSILKTNVFELLKGNLRTAWKRYGSTNSAGPVVFYGDRVTDTSVFVGGLTRLDQPDGNRRMFSDCVTTQRFNCPVQVPTNSTVLGSAMQFAVAPYNIEANWTASPPTHIQGNRLSGGVYPSWWNGDKITIRIASFRAGLPASDADQVRFITPAEDPDAVIVRFEGMTTDPNGGDPTGTPTSPTATNPHLTSPVPSGNRILKHGQGLNVAIDANGDMVITLQSGTVDTELQEFVDALQGNTSTAFVQKVMMHVEFGVLYGAGRGLSHRPDYIHTCHYRGSPTNTSRVLLRDGLSDKNRMVPTYLGDSPYVQTGNNRTYARTSDLMIDPGSKSVYIAPYRNVQIPALLVRDGSRLNWYDGGTQFQGAMPQYDIDGTTRLYSDQTMAALGALFYRGTESRYVEVPLEYLPRPGLHHVPIVPVSNTVFSSGINFLLMAKEGPNANTSDYNQNLVSYPNAAGYYIVTPQVGESYGSSSGSVSFFGRKYTNTSLQGQDGGPFRGIQFPPFMAPARITGVYLRNGNAVVPSSSPFDNNRVFVGGAGKDVNLLRDNFDGPTFLLETNSSGDVVFILNADVIDLSKAPTGTTFDTADFLVECVLFGYDRGFLQTNGRICVAKLSGGGSTAVAPNSFTDTTDVRIGLVTPAPLSAGSTNNEVTIYYSRTPYQGDVFGSQTAYSDDPYRRGPLTPSEASSIFNNPLGPVSTLTLPNKVGYEVLAAMSFVTSLGTGRLSGSAPIPLLSQEEAPGNPPDYAGTWTDLDRRFSLSRVGYEDWASVKFPVTAESVASRPPLKIGALSDRYDHDLHPEFAGCTVHLPLGAYFRDKDFLGKTLYQSRSTSGIGSIPLGVLSVIPFEAAQAKAAQGSSTWEGTEFVCGSASGTSGIGTESIVCVDGTSSTTDVQVFKTARGGAGYSATGPWPGGLISSRFPKARFNSEAGSLLVATAYLVKSHPQSLGSSEVHPGHELQMVVVTQGIPGYFRDTDIIHSASGAGEGFTAVDRFRILGRPLEKKRGTVNVAALPSGKPLFQNRVFDDPLFFGSSDVSLISQKQELLEITEDGQTTLSLSFRPLDPTAVQIFLNGVKLKYGIDYTVGGVTDQVVTYLPSSSNPSLRTTDVVEAFYLLF